jgi:hypothetical protein
MSSNYSILRSSDELHELKGQTRYINILFRHLINYSNFN